MGFGFKQPLVGEKRCVTTQITAAKETMVWGQAGFFSAPPLARNSRSPRARLAFASVRLKYAKNHACSAGYGL